MAQVVLGVSGGIAAYKACELVRELQRREVDVRVAMTAHATRLVAPLTFEALTRHPVYLDPFGSTAGEPITHIGWASAADLLLVAPATANILGKMAHGIADDALTTLYLAATGPVIVAPAMNVEMWRHPAVQDNLAALRRRGVVVVEPESGYLACGTIGEGRLAGISQISDVVCASLRGQRDLEGLSVLVTAGPTREPMDAVRFISNPSTGKMGFRIAEAARDRGARVRLVAGPTTLPTPWGVEAVAVTTAAEMHRAVDSWFDDSDILVMAAAVGDHRPAKVTEGKPAKATASSSVELVPNPDIVAEMARRKGRRLVVGFAAETHDLASRAGAKLVKKGLDLVVANSVASPDTGFESDSNAATLIDPQGTQTDIPIMSKRALADAVWDRIVALRSSRT